MRRRRRRRRSGLPPAPRSDYRESRAEKMANGDVDESLATLRWDVENRGMPPVN